MPMIKIWIHLVWATKSRKLLLDKSIRQKVWQHMRTNALAKQIHIDFINGHVDHVHILLSINADQTIAKIVQLIKGESSFWINKNNLCDDKFEWQDDYFAVSISESGVNAVREYIKNQEAHHAKKTFQQEYDEFMNKYGFLLIKDSQG
ncbi:MAG: IS200/IS605 family transposase [Chitinophagaceae bacterium]|nr:IS200/IS605 family transposase [Chitinophagaceae bacterium]